MLRAERGDDRMAHPVPEIARQLGDLSCDQPIALDRQFHRLGGLCPDIRFVHSGIPFEISGKDASTLVALQHRTVPQPFQSKNPPVVNLAVRACAATPRYCGILAKPCISGTLAQGNALSQYICIAGVTEVGSFRVPTPIMVIPSMTSAVWVTVVPHAGQKDR